MMNKYIFFISFCLLFQFVSGQTAYEIEVEVRDTTLSEIYLGYHYGKAQYISDTATAEANGVFRFVRDEPLEGGVYLLVFPPNNLYLELLIDSLEQKVTLSTELKDLTKTLKIKTKGQNQDFYDYVSLVDENKRKVADITAQRDSQEISKEDFDLRKSKIDEEIKSRQEKLMERYDGRMIDVVLSSARQIEVPEFDSLSGNALRMAQFAYYKEHYFDYVDLKDDRLLKTPFLFQKLNDYVERMTYQHPDSIAVSIDLILGSMDPDSEMFKYYLIHFVNKYASSKIVGFDAVYVHIVEKYYAQGMASWTSEEDLAKLTDQAQKLKPLLLGKIAPNTTLTLRDESEIDIHSIDAEILVLFFWDPKCGVCKKSMPMAVDFYKKYKDKGVKILGVCNKRGEETKQCWDIADEKGISDWMLAYDPTGYYKIKYDVKSTPLIYILDSDKTILSKRIGAQQLEDVVGRLLEQQQSQETSAQ